ncbi:MAG: HAD family hydrolase [Terriglobales bacterium]
MASRAIRVAIFDLDDTLYDCLGQRVRRAHLQAARALAKAGVPASAQSILRVRMNMLEREPRLEPMDREVCCRFGVPFTARLHELSRRAYFSAPVGRLRLFPGARPVLRRLHRLGVKVLVVSYGDPATQRSKVRALGLDREPAVDGISYADTDKITTKAALFRRLLRRLGGPPASFLVVGDKPSSEIRAGKRLGMRTVRMRHGEFARIEAATRHEQADFEIRSIRQLLTLPFHFESAGAGRRTRG